MSSKTLKQFAQEIKIDKKKLEDKLRYQKKVYGREFGTISAGIKYLSEEEQIAICQLLNIPIKKMGHIYRISNIPVNEGFREWVINKKAEKT